MASTYIKPINSNLSSNTVDRPTHYKHTHRYQVAAGARGEPENQVCIASVHQQLDKQTKALTSKTTVNVVILFEETDSCI